MTFASVRIDIEKTDAKLLLLGVKKPAYYSPFCSTAGFLYVKIEPLTFRRKSYDINRTLFHSRCVSVTALGKQPTYSYKFAPLALDVSIVGFFHK